MTIPELYPTLMSSGFTDRMLWARVEDCDCMAYHGVGEGFICVLDEGEGSIMSVEELHFWDDELCERLETAVYYASCEA